MHRRQLLPLARLIAAAVVLLALVTPAMAFMPSLTGSGVVSGAVFFDANGDGARGLDETGIADVVVEARDATTGSLVATATTALDGSYQLAALAVGNYLIVETDPAGYVSTTTNSRPVAVGASALTGIDFGDTLTYIVKGIVWDDQNGDGAQSRTEPGIPDVPVQVYDDANTNGLVDSGETLLAATVSDAVGSYIVRDILPGNRVLRIMPPSGAGSPGGNQVGVQLISSDGMGANTYFQNFPLVTATEPRPACAYNTAIVSSFNGTAIPSGRTVWVSSRLKAKTSSLGPGETTVYFENALLQFPANNTAYSVALPRAKVIYSPTATSTTTAYDAATQTWVTTVSPGNWDKDIFLSGVAIPAPAAGFPAGIKPVTVGGRLGSSKYGVVLEWRWAAAVYTSFATDYTLLGVKPVSSNAENPYNNGDKAGTPEQYRAFVVGGGRGGGGSNYTGDNTPSARGLCASPADPPYEQRVNCGSVSYTDAGHQVWSADRRYGLGAWGYLDGTLRSSNSAVSGTADDFLYQKYHEKPGEYRFTVPNGTYDVLLKFAEFVARSAGERPMKITIEGAVAESALSVFGQAGSAAALDRTYTATVSDGLLNIGFERASGATRDPAISAIEVRVHGSASTPTSTPTPSPTPTDTPAPTATPTPLPYDQAVNSGSVTYTDAANTVWAGDKKYVTGSWGFMGGSAKTVVVPINNTTEDALYQSYRENMNEYRFTVPNGSYIVTLAFAELVATKDTDRIMKITIEGNVVEPALNLFVSPGPRTALDKTYTVTVTDGVLNIAFDRTGGSAKEPIVNAIKVRSQ